MILIIRLTNIINHVVELVSSLQRERERERKRTGKNVYSKSLNYAAVDYHFLSFQIGRMKIHLLYIITI